MKKTKAVLHVAEGVTIFLSFIGISSCFPSGGILTQNESLLDFWAVPMAFLAVAVILEKCSQYELRIPWWIAPLCSSVAAGVWLGLSLGAVLILNEWYVDPENGTWEPLFTATGLSAAGVLAAERWYKKIHGKEKGKPGRSHA